jgi:hypothetical protein
VRHHFTHTPTKLWTIALTVAASACACPANEAGIAVSPSKYAAEREAACAAAPGCSAEAMEEVRVYEVSTRDEVQTLCQNEQAWACYCFEAIGCQTVFLMPNAHDNALHEMVHAALDVTGIDTRNHGPIFDQTLTIARKHLRAARSH